MAVAAAAAAAAASEPATAAAVTPTAAAAAFHGWSYKTSNKVDKSIFSLPPQIGRADEQTRL